MQYYVYAPTELVVIRKKKFLGKTLEFGFK